MDIAAEIQSSSEGELASYLTAASRDGTLNRLHRTLRIAQADIGWLEILQSILARLGARGWIYQEGDRDVWVIETTWRGFRAPITRGEQAAFARGYFDAEGGIPWDSGARFYIQLVQKDKPDLARLRTLLEKLGIMCGRLHNPSVLVDPDYWRFYIRTASQVGFISKVGSWHPRKRALLGDRFERLQVSS